MISDGLKKLISEKNLTVRQVSELSNVPVSTINRILSSQTEDPGIQTVTAIICAIGGSLDELMGTGPEDTNKEHHKESQGAVIEIYERELAGKDRWIHRLFILCCVLLAFLISYVILDSLEGKFGIIRY
ncbi:MAG: helix-turn-helix domain-containing protein [Faecousia sp.]